MGHPNLDALGAHLLFGCIASVNSVYEVSSATHSMQVR